MGGSRGADWTGYGWLAEEDRNRRKTEEKRKKGRKEGALGGGDFSRKTRGKEEVKEKKKEGRTYSPGIALGSGMILIYFASPILNCSPQFLVSVWIPLTFEDHLCNLFSVLGML